MINKEPKYLNDILVVARQDLGRPRRVGTSSSYQEKAVCIKVYSKLPETITAIEQVQLFKKKVRIWVKKNISIYMEISKII